jgi:hypothetical protein
MWMRKGLCEQISAEISEAMDGSGFDPGVHAGKIVGLDESIRHVAFVHEKKITVMSRVYCSSTFLQRETNKRVFTALTNLIKSLLDLTGLAGSIHDARLVYEQSEILLLQVRNFIVLVFCDLESYSSARRTEDREESMRIAGRTS